MLTRSFALVAFLLALVAPTLASARQMGDYSKPVSQACMEKIKKLSSPSGGNCCAGADGWEAKEAVWDVEKGKYVVTIEGKPYEVPDGAVVKQPNCSGMAIVWYYWPMRSFQSDGETIRTMPRPAKPAIRCFWPGAQSSLMPATSGLFLLPRMG